MTTTKETPIQECGFKSLQRRTEEALNAGVDPLMEIRPGFSLLQRLASFPDGVEGDRLASERIEEVVSFKAAAARETASATRGISPPAPPMGDGNGGSSRNEMTAYWQ